MIEIHDKKDCCGCSACVQSCPKLCISLHEDNEGFLYPTVDKELCIDCHLCERVCPVINQEEFRKPIEVFAAKNPDEEIKRQSSSGGVFTMLAEAVINQGGVVFGARWGEQYHLVSDYTETTEGLKAFRGSKYLQCEVGNSFTVAEEFLKQGRKVLFSGTPCQIAALKRFLKKDYGNLLAIDFICHGVPSPGVFRQYMKETEQLVAEGDKKYRFASLAKTSDVSKIDGLAQPVVYFRDKVFGWKKYRFAFHLKAAESGSYSVSPSTSKASFGTSKDAHVMGFRRNAQNLLGGKRFTLWKKLPEVLEWREGDEIVYSDDCSQNIYMRAFLQDIILRPSCYSCPARHLKSHSDITMGDYWGIGSIMPNLDDDKGVSALIINTEKGMAALNNSKPLLWLSSFEDLTRRNPAIITPPKPHYKRGAFFKHDDWSIHQRVILYAHAPLKARIKAKIIHYAVAMVPKNLKQKVKVILKR